MKCLLQLFRNMFANKIKVIGNKNSIIQKANNSIINIQNNDKADELAKQLFDIIHKSDNCFEGYIGMLTTKGFGVQWRTEESIRNLYQTLHAIEVFANENKYYLQDMTYNQIMDHFQNLQTAHDFFDLLTMTIACIDDYDGCDNVYSYHYPTVRDMMIAFYEIDKHPAYMDFADAYDKYKTSYRAICQLIENNRRTRV